MKAEIAGRHDERKSSPEYLINLDRYPLNDPDGEKMRAVIEEGREQLRQDGVCLMKGFLTDDAVHIMEKETDAIAGQAYRLDKTHNVYLEKDSNDFPRDHPRRRHLRTIMSAIAYDQVPEGSALRDLYEWDNVTQFIGEIMRQTLFRMADPLSALTINVMLPGDVQAWHFDEAQFVTTIMVKAPEGGGEFEYVPNLRSGAVEPYAEVNAVLSRTHPGIKKLPFTPGDMSIFCGGRSVHGVNAVHGPRSRYVAVLSYKDRPGFVNSAEVQQLFYGRTKQLSHADQQ